MYSTISFALAFFLFSNMAIYSQNQDIIMLICDAQVEYPAYKSLIEVKKNAKDSAVIHAFGKAFSVIKIGKHGN